ncbi:SDR family NAD(P)-dependent oxidoreductase [Kocuria sp. cx-455]|uniref:SDR family NAD(P)-dependent oxidoreductase n=1 Tax=Kocuria sp. cx-455 TaxID=2771377 RepID=UPI003D720C1B
MTDNFSPGTAKVAMVTGAAGGMGSYMAHRLHKDGFSVVLTDINQDAVTALARDISPDGATAIGLQHDVAQREDFVRVLAQTQECWKTPEVLVNNAAVTQAADLMTLTQSDFDRVLDTNTNSIFFGCQVVGGAMAETGYGRIINMASLAGQNGGTATGAHYAASKGAILTITKIFAKEFASSGVTVNSISPGPHDLPIVHTTVPADRLEAVVSGIPVQRLGEPQFIADTVALLASENAYFVTGACWDINGGLYVR